MGSTTLNIKSTYERLAWTTHASRTSRKSVVNKLAPLSDYGDYDELSIKKTRKTLCISFQTYILVHSMGV